MGSAHVRRPEDIQGLSPVALAIIALAGAASILAMELAIGASPAIVVASAIGICGGAAIAVRSVGQDRTGEAPASQSSPADRREFRQLPFENPFAASAGDLSLEDRITLAAERSKQFGRSICILHCSVPGYQERSASHGRAAADAMVAKIAESMRERVRPSDHVAIVGKSQIVVCLNLIKDLTNSQLVADRLGRGIAALPDWPAPHAPIFGRALYPMHGYNGADLIEAARSRSRRDGAAVRKRTGGGKPRATRPREPVSSDGLSACC